MSKDLDVIGTGWSFPPSFDMQSAGVRMSSGVEDIHESLYILFTTELGERLLQPKFGCSLSSMQMEALNTQALGYADKLLRTAILYHEPRIDVEAINFDVSSEPGFLMIDIEYTVRQSKARFNYVYPFYLEEGRLV